MFWQSAHAGTISLPQASTYAANVDKVNDFIFCLSVFFTVAVPAVMVWFMVKYHRSKKGRRTEQIDHSTFMEVTWTVIPLVLMLFIFWWGWVEFKEMRTPRRNALEINVLGRQWLWNFQYNNGRTTMNDMVVPINRPVKLIMTSEDVLHSFYVPNFRIKQDVVPGTYTAVYFTATQTGVHKIYCTEYCGTSHSDMLGRVIVTSNEEYENWLNTGEMPAVAATAPLTPPTRSLFKTEQLKGKSAATDAASDTAGQVSALQKSPAERGRALHASKGCVACHSVDGVTKVGPTMKGLFGSEVQLADGSKVTADENYLRESIEMSNAKVVKGFAPSMPLYKGTLTDEEIGSLIAYIKSLK
jgi:cytochrome c oxidase subunit 2